MCILEEIFDVKSNASIFLAYTKSNTQIDYLYIIEVQKQ